MEENEAPSGYPGDLPPKIGGLCAYLLGWVSGLIVFFTQDDRRVRFHAAQSVIVFGSLSVLLLGWSAMGEGFLDTLLFLLAWGCSLSLWGFLCYQGYRLTGFKVPIAGVLAERWEARELPPR